MAKPADHGPERLGSPARVRVRQSNAAYLHRTLAGLPELDQFESEQDRDAALARLERDARRPGKLQFFLYFGIGLPIMILILLSVDFLWNRNRVTRGLPEIARDAVVYGMYAIAMMIIVRWVQRVRAPRLLRERLLAAGVPVCRQCGYALRGLKLETARCPECGREFDEDVREILRIRA
jgi:hypothetical protein